MDYHFFMEKVLLRIVDSKPYKLDDLLNNPLLSEKDEADSLKYLRTENKKERAVANILRNKYIGKCTISSRGKPLAKGKHFNISHSKGIVCLAISNKDVGVDLEVIRPVDIDFKEFIASKDEKNLIHDDETFFMIWTNKESLLKCLGLGMKSSMDKVPSLPFNNIKFFDKRYFYSKSIKYKNSIITVTRASSEPFEIEILEETI